MDIRGLGERTAAQLLERGLVRDVSDIYRLTAQDLLQLEGFADVSANHLVDAIAETKQRPLSRVLFALGIRHVGAHVAQVIEREFPEMDLLLNADEDRLAAVHGIGRTTAAALAAYLGAPANRSLIERLRATGVNLTEPVVRAEHTSLAGEVFVITGTHTRSRKDLTELIERHGGRVSGTVSRTTDYVVAGENPGSKLDRARELSVPILDEQGLLDKLEETAAANETGGSR
jgi:DNA ligase (NAD+)